MNSKNAIVVIPTYNAKKSIVHVINKILKTTNNTEVIVIDDNSPDNTQSLVKKQSTRR